MSYRSNIICTTLFETSEISVFKIPPGEISISKWKLDDSNIIWKGNLRLVEQEIIQDVVEVFSSLPNDLADTRSLMMNDEIGSYIVEPPPQQRCKTIPIEPYRGLRLKVELFNEIEIPPTVGNLSTIKKDSIWAEVWYNPLPSNSESQEYLDGLNCTIANNGQETIQMALESPRYYKIIAQLPGSGYQPYKRGENIENYEDDEGLLLQIALGLNFNDSFKAISFAESLNIYKRRFRNFEVQYKYELRLIEIEERVKKYGIENNNRDDSSEDDNALFNLDMGNNNEYTHQIINKSNKFEDDLSESAVIIEKEVKDEDNEDNDYDDDDDDDFGEFVGS